MDRDLESASPEERVAEAYDRFRSAETSMRERVRGHTATSENELRMIQFLVSAGDAGKDVKPGELTRHLGISSASTTALMDRLERAGSLERFAHPTDRRSILISATPSARDKVKATIGAFESRLHELSAGLSEDARNTVVDFLDALAEAADAVAAVAPAR
ncbi:MarR family winged helix-turn-helix transcriptional regulator [Microbacterium sp. SS28]|uniref:MarR family winged helix-turn-helix transcriptional regulator n=1 Tax=Microbacterium sp. SS28 TaxID=2919948 RepID=UPI001FAA88B3|nr:MarR family transcriptional regulator [Microbacterium sp. SS28]